MGMRNAMIRVTAILLTGQLLTLGNASAIETYSQSDAEHYIQAAESDWAESLTGSDASVVKRFLADDFVGVLDGEVYDKAQAITDASKQPSGYLSNHLEYAHVKFFGDTAVVQGSEMWTRKGGRKGRFVWIDTWILRNGQWQVVGAEDISVLVKKK